MPRQRSALKRLKRLAAELPCSGCGVKRGEAQRHPTAALLEDLGADDRRRMLWLRVTPAHPQGFYADLSGTNYDEPLSGDERERFERFAASHARECPLCGRVGYDFSVASDEDIKLMHVLMSRFARELWSELGEPFVGTTH